jgi:hypothetical protein
MLHAPRRPTACCFYHSSIDPEAPTHSSARAGGEDFRPAISAKSAVKVAQNLKCSCPRRANLTPDIPFGAGKWGSCAHPRRLASPDDEVGGRRGWILGGKNRSRSLNVASSQFLLNPAKAQHFKDRSLLVLLRQPPPSRNRHEPYAGRERGRLVSGSDKDRA